MFFNYYIDRIFFSELKDEIKTRLVQITEGYFGESTRCFANQDRWKDYVFLTFDLEPYQDEHSYNESYDLAQQRYSNMLDRMSIEFKMAQKLLR